MFTATTDHSARAAETRSPGLANVPLPRWKTSLLEHLVNIKLTSVEGTDPYQRSWRREHTAVRTVDDALMGKMGKFCASCAIKISIGAHSLTFFSFSQVISSL